MDENELLEIWFERKNLSKSTRETYTRYIKQYSNFTGKSLTELYQEGLKEEKANVFFPERKYNHYAIRFIKHIRDDKSRNTMNTCINAITGFYKSHHIREPELTREKGDITKEKNYGRPLAKKDIQRLVDVANARDTAIIYTMALSGFSQQEMTRLTLRKFLLAVNMELDRDFTTIKEVLGHEKEAKEQLLQVDITREKVHYRYTTFIPPESVQRILIYLRERYNLRHDHMHNLDDALLQRVGRTPLTRSSVNNIFRGLGKRAGFRHEKGTYRYWRSHALRHYFITTIIDEIGDYSLANYLAGHKISDQDRTYWRPNPKNLRKKYLRALPYLSLDEGKVLTFESEEYRNAITKISKLQSEQEKANTEIQNLKPLADIITQNPELLEQIVAKMTKEDR